MMLDQQLLNDMAAGSTHAFALFYDRHAGRVFGALLKWLGHRGDAEDVLQDTFWQVWCRAGQYDAARSVPEIWLFVIARCRALDYLRRHRRERRIAVESEPVTTSEPSAALECSESAEQVREALGKLSEEQRSAICLAFYEGLTYDQVARSQAIPLGTAKTRIRAGIKRLRELLRDERKVISR
jgi:RNA polymerase sigma-70 factor (ECF subfamily)